MPASISQFFSCAFSPLTVLLWTSLLVLRDIDYCELGLSCFESALTFDKINTPIADE